ncbi:MAG: hypothetical protein KatS3mg108_2263 [Isosphaeraceae bacterium]|jgi:hypothetical protein|nr:MAG: hypothetical protein KatS3mg108_2263 [Isosphaeraceae bacterium]
MTTNGDGQTVPATQPPEDIERRQVRQRELAALIGLLAVAAVVRFAGLGRASLWYDELVSYQVAAEATPLAALERLHRTDATRAPLHPLMLQGWFRVFGTSVPAGRALSAVCGVALVAVVFLLGRCLFDDGRAAWWAAGLTTFSPPLVYYARELRMYALLVLVSALGWLVAALRGQWTRWRTLLYVFLVVALGYTHPLGGLMIAALAVFVALDRRNNGLNVPRWLAVHGLAALLLVPAVGAYLSSSPTYDEPAGRSLRLLLGFPIGFIGGNFWILGGCVAVIAAGLRSAARQPRAVLLLLVWLLGPVLLLYGASWIGRPLFGPARYTLFVAPAYLLLLGYGLARLPAIAALGAGVVLAGCMAQELKTTVYADGLKADWKAAAVLIRSIDGPAARPDVAIAVVDRRYLGELDVARHYLGTAARIRVAEPPWPDDQAGWLAVGLRQGRPAAPLPLDVAVPTPILEVYRVPGLLLLRARAAESRPAVDPSR